MPSCGNDGYGLFSIPRLRGEVFVDRLLRCLWIVGGWMDSKELVCVGG